MEAICIAPSAYRAAPASRRLSSVPRRPPPPPVPRRLSPPPVASAAASSESRSNRMFVFGTGFVGRYVSQRLKLDGWDISGTCTSPNKQGELVKMGLDGFLFDVHKSELRSLTTLKHATHVLISIPPIVGYGDPLLCLHDDLRRILSCGNLQCLCYLSSTSVYGDCGGAWVNEDYPVNPESESAKSRFIAEKGWLDLGRELGVPVNILRLGGIYGPGRSALDTIVKHNIMSEEQKNRESRIYTARIHVADIWQAVKASLGSRASGRIYNIVDDDPAPREVVFTYARTLIEERWPGMITEFSGDVINPKPKKRNKGGEKRVSNARLKEELGIKLLYPTYRSGLQSILDSWDSNIDRP